MQDASDGIDYDVIVVGAGNAGLCAAIAALEEGASVAVLDKAPESERGGNSALTVTMRVPSNSIEELESLLADDVDEEGRRELRARYVARNEAHLREELIRASSGNCDRALLDTLMDGARSTIAWLHGHGHRWRPSLDTTSHNPLMMDGRGYGYQQRNFSIVDRLGGHVVYGATAMEVISSHGGAGGVIVKQGAQSKTMTSRSVILACGGYEANPEMRVRYLGPEWESVHLRGVPFNTGDGFHMAWRLGAMSAGGWGSCHASPQDWDRPSYGMPSLEPGLENGGFGWSRYSYPFGILVNIRGERFIDEASDVRGMTYAKIGREILRQPGGVAYQIFDADARRRGLIAHVYDDAERFCANDVAALALKAGIDPHRLEVTMREYNRSRRTGELSPSAVELDGYATTGLPVDKTNFASPVAEPPFEAYKVRCGMTFTYGGLKIDPRTAQVLDTGGQMIDGLYAAGEIVGGLFYGSYPGGSGMLAGSVVGEIAGRHAARSRT